MNKNPARRSRLTELAAKRQSWDLEDLKAKQRLALDAFEKAEKAVEEVAEDISRAEQHLGRVMSGQCSLNLAEIEAIRIYMSEQQSRYKKFLANFRRASIIADQANSRVKHAALAVRALGNVKHKADTEVLALSEQDLLEQNMELWLQRAYGERNGDN